MDFEALEFLQSRFCNLMLSVPVHGFGGFRRILVLSPYFLASFGAKCWAKGVVTHSLSLSQLRFDTKEQVWIERQSLIREKPKMKLISFLYPLNKLAQRNKVTASSWLTNAFTSNDPLIHACDCLVSTTLVT